MDHPGFFTRSGPFSVGAIAKATATELGPGADPSVMIADVKALQAAGPGDLTFLDNRKYLTGLGETLAGACILAPEYAKRAPAATATLQGGKPYQAFTRAMTLFYKDALRPKAAGSHARRETRLIDPSAEIDDSVTIEPGAVIGREAKIGAGTIVAAGAVIGYRVVIGKDCYVGANSSVIHAIVGNGVIIHAGVQIGHDGFGFAMSPAGHEKIAHIGRVLIGDDVEVGANSTIDRGSLSDTIVGEGTKIDNLVQLGHNVVVGRHCIIAAQSGIAGSTQLGDFVIIGGQAGIFGHLKIATGTQIAGTAHVTRDTEPGSRMGGTPAQSFNVWARELAALRKIAKAGRR